MRSTKQQFGAWGITLIVIALLLAVSEAQGQETKIARVKQYVQEAFTRDTEIFTFRKSFFSNTLTIKGERVILAFQRAEMMRNDKGEERIVKILVQRGRIECRSCSRSSQLRRDGKWSGVNGMTPKDLAPGMSWSQHDYDFKEHRVTVEVKEIEGP